MNKTILETAIILKEWSLILNEWQELRISETMFPPHLRYVELNVKDDITVMVYLLDSLIKSDFNLADKIIPYIPFSYLYFAELDVNVERLMKTYVNRYQTPLLFLAPEDDKLKERIDANANFASKLSDVIFFKRNDIPEVAWKSIIARGIQRIIPEAIDSNVGNQNNNVA